jgi:hypothetical protein
MSSQAGQKRGFETSGESMSTTTEEGDNTTNVVPPNAMATASDETNGDSESQVLKRAKLSDTENTVASTIEQVPTIKDDSNRTADITAKHGFDEGKLNFKGVQFPALLIL